MDATAGDSVHDDLKEDAKEERGNGGGGGHGDDECAAEAVIIGVDDDEKGDELRAGSAVQRRAEGDSLELMFPKENRLVVRLRGLPWSARESEIRSFFEEEEVVEIQIVYLTDGRASGEALVEFADLASFQSAFLKNRNHIGHRYIEIFKSTAMEIDTSAGRASRPPARPPQSQYVVRMRGLPYSATDDDVAHFFAATHPTGTHLIKDDLGRPSGEGFVEFGCEVDAIAAMARHRHHMGHRYIELFRSSPTELMRALGLSSGWRPQSERAAAAAPGPVSSACVLMRGLPYSCTESDITKFFQEIEVTPIRIHRKADGAEAYVEFYSVSDTDQAMTRHRSYIGTRYIELFRVSYDDMARTVGLPVHHQPTGPEQAHRRQQHPQQQHPHHSQQQHLSAFALNPSNVVNPIPAANAAASAVNNAQSVMTTNFALPPLTSITPHYGSVAPHSGMAGGGHYGGQYMANPLLSATNMANSLLSGIYGPPHHSASATAFQNGMSVPHHTANGQQQQQRYCPPQYYQ